MTRFFFSLILGLCLSGSAAAGQDVRMDLAGPAPGAANAASKRVLGYGLVLLLGDTQGSATPDGLSAPAQKALTDIKDFLPYKSYRLLDTAWSAGSESGATASGQLKGTLDGEYFSYSAAYSQLNQRFQLWTADRKTVLMDSTFTMRPGETVVVGSSRVQGDRALVVLLTISTEDIFEPGMSGVVTPMPTQIPRPVYTRAAQAAGIAGTVTLQCVVLPDGVCGDVTVLKSLDAAYGLDQQAVDNLKGWRFKPGTKDGKPVAVRVHVDVEFTLR
jgi:TonB family protein